MNQYQKLRDKVMKNKISEYWKNTYGKPPSFLDSISPVEVKILWKDLKQAKRIK